MTCVSREIIIATPFNLQIWTRNFNADICDVRLQLRDLQTYVDNQPVTHKMDFVIKYEDIERIMNCDCIKFVKKTKIGEHMYFSGRIIEIVMLQDVAKEAVSTIGTQTECDELKEDESTTGTQTECDEQPYCDSQIDQANQQIEKTQTMSVNNQSSSKKTTTKRK